MHGHEFSSGYGGYIRDLMEYSTELAKAVIFLTAAGVVRVKVFL
mgnify:CR=1 FL=1